MVQLNTTGNKIAKAMASTTGWNSSTELGAIGNDQSLNNSSGFNALPEGYCQFPIGFIYEGSWAIFWSSTVAENDSENVHLRNLNNSNGHISRGGNYRYDGLSVRFVRD